MKLPNLKRIAPEDFPDQPWIGKLLSPLNSFLSVVTAGLNKGIDSANMSCTRKTMRVVVSASTYPISFRWPLAARPTDLWITQAKQDSASPEVITTAVWADWDYVNGQIQINHISGLTSGKTYNVTFFVMANPQE